MLTSGAGHGAVDRSFALRERDREKYLGGGYNCCVNTADRTYVILSARLQHLPHPVDGRDDVE